MRCASGLLDWVVRLFFMLIVFGLLNHSPSAWASPDSLQWHPNSTMLTWLEHGPTSTELKTIDLRGQSSVLLNSEGPIELSGSPQKAPATIPPPLQATDLSQGLLDLNQPETTAQNNEPIKTEKAPSQAPKEDGFFDAPLDLHNYQWSPSGQELLLQRQNDLILMSYPELVAQRLTNSPKQIKDSPQFGPDGSKLLYGSQGHLYLVDIGSQKTNRITPEAPIGVLQGHLPREAGQYPISGEQKSAVFSPNGLFIAYLTMDLRKNISDDPLIPFDSTAPFKIGEALPQFSVEVIDLKGQSVLHYPAKTGHYIAANIAWKQDSSAIAITEINRDQEQLSLKLIGIEGENPLLLHQENMPNWLNPVTAPVFLDNDKSFMWMSPYYGYYWPYLGKTDAPGKKLKKMLRVPWNLELIHVDTQGKYLFFKGSGDEYTEQHLFKIKANGNGFTRLTHRWGWHEGLISPDGSSFVDTFSDLKTPPETTIWQDRKKVGTLEGIKVQRDIHFEKVIAITEQDIKLNSMLIHPANYDKRKQYPLVIHLGDGPAQQHVTDQYRIGDLDLRLLEAGYLILRIDVRGSGNRKHRFEAAIDGQPGKVEYQDLQSILNKLQGRAYVDWQNIHLLGEGYGAYLALYFASEGMDIRSITSLGLMGDWSQTDGAYAERYLGLSFDINSALSLRQKAPKVPLLLVHGIQDQQRSYQHSLDLAHVASDLVLIPTGHYNLEQFTNEPAKKLMQSIEYFIGQAAL